MSGPFSSSKTERKTWVLRELCTAAVRRPCDGARHHARSRGFGTRTIGEQLLARPSHRMRRLARGCASDEPKVLGVVGCNGVFFPDGDALPGCGDAGRRSRDRATL